MFQLPKSQFDYGQMRDKKRREENSKNKQTNKQTKTKSAIIFQGNQLLNCIFKCKVMQYTLVKFAGTHRNTIRCFNLLGVKMSAAVIFPFTFGFQDF